MFPTSVGLNRNKSCISIYIKRVPHIRGAEPPPVIKISLNANNLELTAVLATAQGYIVINTFEKIKMSLTKNGINSIEVKGLISGVIEQDLDYIINDPIMLEICRMKMIIKNKILISQELSYAKEHIQTLIDRGYIDTVDGLVAAVHPHRCGEHNKYIDYKQNTNFFYYLAKPAKNRDFKIIKSFGIF